MIEFYNGLKQLVEENEMFFSSIQQSFNGRKMEIFSYHFTVPDNWTKPYALESRGIMFDITDSDNPLIVSRPMEKFFNVGENELAPVSLLDDVVVMYDKLDGSLISTYLDGDTVRLKSKGSLHSDQANDANRLLLRRDWADFKQQIEMLAKDGFTVNMEYTSPKNQIVVAYDQPRLTILNIRDTETGVYIPYSELIKHPNINKYLVGAYLVDSVDVDAIRAETGHEGYVLETESGTKLKIKNDWYVNLHRVKDDINNNRRLVEAIIEERTDDMRALFSEDPSSLEKIKDFEKYFTNALYGMMTEVINVVETLQGKSRKDFAIKAQTMVSYKPLFSVVMRCYEKVDREDIMKKLLVIATKNWQDFVPEKYKD